MASTIEPHERNKSTIAAKYVRVGDLICGNSTRLAEVKTIHCDLTRDYFTFGVDLEESRYDFKYFGYDMVVVIPNGDDET